MGVAVGGYVDGHGSRVVDVGRRHRWAESDGPEKRAYRGAWSSSKTVVRLVVLSPERTATTRSCWRQRWTRVVAPTPSTASAEAHRLSLDKGYDNPTERRTVQDYGYAGHVCRIGEEKLSAVGEKAHPARHWVVERTHARLLKFRSSLGRSGRQL